jgi:hypothetical protein
MMVDSIYSELKERDVHYYPYSLKEACSALLFNEKLLNTFVKIVFQKTYAFDVATVIDSIELVANWFHTVHKNHALIPADFDFSFFMKAIGMLLNMDHAVGTSKGIWLLY